jgi:quinol monooxygenase YgiN
MPKGTVTLTGHIDVPAVRMEDIQAALRVHIALTRAEPGCLSFEVTPCPDVEGRFLVSEAFVDQQAFDAHQARTKASEWAKASEGIPRDYSIKVEQ